eukprot:TRINITY_DN2030_c0_g2_i4.p1 TRINITY_DN2030_c0_g2~~TRINITY_DN2030_c0_g2_i4.p1  ORF type:complete len:329 (-),score=90.27 TRINITY_DN2030_c0_g2_i4:110-1096(-)
MDFKSALPKETTATTTTNTTSNFISYKPMPRGDSQQKAAPRYQESQAFVIPAGNYQPYTSSTQQQTKQIFSSDLLRGPPLISQKPPQPSQSSSLPQEQLLEELDKRRKIEDFLINDGRKKNEEIYRLKELVLRFERKLHERDLEIHDLKRKLDSLTRGTKAVASPMLNPVATTSQEEAKVERTPEEEDLILALKLQEEETRRYHEGQRRRHHFRHIFGPSRHHRSIEHDDGLDPDQMTYEELISLGEKIGSVSKGLSEQDIAKLKVVQWNSTCNTDEEEICCNVCLNGLQDEEEVFELGCQHRFHCECLKPWLAKEKVCPVCKMEIKL